MFRKRGLHKITRKAFSNFFTRCYLYDISTCVVVAEVRKIVIAVWPFTSLSIKVASMKIESCRWWWIKIRWLYLNKFTIYFVRKFLTATYNQIFVKLKIYHKNAIYIIIATYWNRSFSRSAIFLGNFWIENFVFSSIS